jgi:hypothetical protein
MRQNSLRKSIFHLAVLFGMALTICSCSTERSAPAMSEREELQRLLFAAQTVEEVRAYFINRGFSEDRAEDHNGTFRPQSLGGILAKQYYFYKNKSTTDDFYHVIYREENGVNRAIYIAKQKFMLGEYLNVYSVCWIALL